MMKRVLCLALAMMLLCGAAMADAAKISVTFEADVEKLANSLELAYGAGEGELDGFAESMVELMSGLEIQFISHESGFYMAMFLEDTLLFDLGAEEDAETQRFFSSLLKDHYLFYTPTAEERENYRICWETLNALDEQKMTADMLQAFEEWLNGLMPAERTDEAGVAEEAKLLTYAFDDQDVVKLVEQLLTVIENHGLTENVIDTYLGVETRAFENIRLKNQEVSANNRYSYVLQARLTPEDEYAGATLLVMEKDQRVMTLAHEPLQDAQRLVWGYGLNGRNYYACFDLKADAAGGKHAELQLLRANEASWSDEVEVNGEKLAGFSGSVYPQIEGEWTTLADLRLDGQEMIHYVVEGVSDQAEGTAEYKVHYEQNDATIHVRVTPCEPVTWDVSSMTAIDQSADGSEDKVNELTEKSILELTVTLFKLLPTELFTMFMQ